MKATHSLRDTLETFHAGELVEIRALGIPSGRFKLTSSGYFDDFDKAALAAATCEQRGAAGVYFILNRIHPGAICRSPNVMTDSPEKTTSDRDIVGRRWILIDVDPVRPSGISSTPDEQRIAERVRDDIAEWLEASSLVSRTIYAHSGNGSHLLVPYADDVALELDRSIEFLEHEFGDPRVTIDATTNKLAQLTKFYGTLTRKGFQYGDRTHRRSFIQQVKG